MGQNRTSVLAIDLGASSGRGIVGTYDPETGLELHEVHRFENGPMEEDAEARKGHAGVASASDDAAASTDGGAASAVGDAGHAADGAEPKPTMRWDIDALLDNIRVAAERAAGAYDLASMGIDTWGVDYGLLDGKGQLVAPPAHYRDPRTAGLAEELAASGSLAGVYEATGIQVMDINTLFQLVAALRADPSLANRARRLLMMPDLLGYLLTGVGGCERSIASTTQLLRADTGVWDEQIAERLGIPSSWLPPVTSEGEPRGSLTLGSGAHIPVLSVCGHDTASAVASVELGDDALFVSCGTWSLVGTELAEPVVTPEAERLNITNERGAENSVLHLENCTGLWIAQELRRDLAAAGTDLSWSEAVRAAEEVPAHACVVDTDAPELASPGSMADKLRYLARETGQPVPETPGELFRCVYDSLALRYRQAREDVERTTGRHFSRVRIIGGGAQNTLLCQVVADVLRTPVVAGPFEATAIGNVLVQLVAHGVFVNLSEARAAVRPSLDLVTYEPREPVPQEVWERYRRACDLG